MSGPHLSGKAPSGREVSGRIVVRFQAAALAMARRPAWACAAWRSRLCAECVEESQMLRGVERLSKRFFSYLCGVAPAHCRDPRRRALTSQGLGISRWSGALPGGPTQGSHLEPVASPVSPYSVRHVPWFPFSETHLRRSCWRAGVEGPVASVSRELLLSRSSGRGTPTVTGTAGTPTVARSRALVHAGSTPSFCKQ